MFDILPDCVFFNFHITEKIVSYHYDWLRIDQCISNGLAHKYFFFFQQNSNLLKPNTYRINTEQHIFKSLSRFIWENLLSKKQLFSVSHRKNSLRDYYSQLTIVYCSFVVIKCKYNTDCKKTYSTCAEARCTCPGELILGERSCEPGKNYIEFIANEPAERLLPTSQPSEDARLARRQRIVPREGCCMQKNSRSTYEKCKCKV